MKPQKTQIKIIKEYFRNKPVLKAYIFGSYSRNNADELSDLDILVDLDYSQKIGLLFIQMKLDLEKLLGIKVDLVSSHGISHLIKPYIDKEKTIIYER